MPNNNNQRAIPSLMTPGVLYGDPSAFPNGKPTTNLMRRGDTVGNPSAPEQNQKNTQSPNMSFLPEGLNDFYSRYNAELTGRPQVAPPKPEETVTPTPPRRTGPIPSETRVDAKGNVQTGRNLTGKLTLGDAVAYLNKSTTTSQTPNGYIHGFGDNTFSSIQLPTTPASVYTSDPKQTPGFDMSVPDIGGANAVNFDRDGGAAAVQSKDLTNNQPITGKEQRIEGASDRPARGTLSEALADKAGINSYMAKFSNGDPEMARRRAFLDAPDSLSGMKAVKAQQNMISVGQKDYFHNDGNLTEMDSGDMRERLAGRMSADDLKNKYVKDITESKVETPAESQNSLSPAGQAVKSEFNKAAKSDFALNNSTSTLQPGVGPVVPADIIENYDFSKPGAEDAYFKPGGILDQYTKR